MTPTQNNPERLLKISEAAALLGVCPLTCWKYTREGRFPSFKLNARALRVRASDLENYIESRLASK